MTEQETLYMMALTRVPALNLTGLHVLIEEMGSATAVYSMDSHLARAEQEWEFCQQNHIRPLGLHDEDYPQRLRDCPDAPVLLYYLGTSDPQAIDEATKRLLPYYAVKVPYMFDMVFSAPMPDAALQKIVKFL